MDDTLAKIKAIIAKIDDRSHFIGLELNKCGTDPAVTEKYARERHLLMFHRFVYSERTSSDKLPFRKNRMRRVIEKGTAVYQNCANEALEYIKVYRSDKYVAFCLKLQDEIRKEHYPFVTWEWTMSAADRYITDDLYAHPDKRRTARYPADVSIAGIAADMEMQHSLWEASTSCRDELNLMLQGYGAPEGESEIWADAVRVWWQCRHGLSVIDDSVERHAFQAVAEFLAEDRRTDGELWSNFYKRTYEGY